MTSRRALIAVAATLVGLLWGLNLLAAVPQGSAEQARAYYRDLAATIAFRNPDTILDSTLNDVPSYLGYNGLSGRDLEQMPSTVLMDVAHLGQTCDGRTPCETAIPNPEDFQRTFRVLPMRPGDILASRFLAPKIANMSEPASSRKLGWRKLVRLRAQRGSLAARNKISDGIVLFNFFTAPGDKPFQADAVSVNTQVMLLSRPPMRNRDSLYWLDYGPLPEGKLSLKLDAAFDAGDLQSSSEALKEYFVPNACVACHGEIAGRPMVNYLDTDHWFDRLNDDFGRVRDEQLPVIVDGGIDPQQLEFARAFDVIRKFNEEANAHASVAQPKSFHLRAGKNWERLHQATNDHIPTGQRGVASQWSDVDQELIGTLNRYCFRCHGTIKFNVFERQEVYRRRGIIASRLKPTPEQLKKSPDFLMPPDRKVPDSERDRLIQLLLSMGPK